MYWTDTGYLLNKNNYSENSVIIDVFTLKHGKISAIVYGGSSKKNKKDLQIGNKILVNYNSKNENKVGYFTTELVRPVSPFFFDDKRKISCILSASSILKVLLPERQTNEKIFDSFENLISALFSNKWIVPYIYWEQLLVKELGFDLNLFEEKTNNSKSNLKSIVVNGTSLKIPELFILKNKNNNIYDKQIKEALQFNKQLLVANFYDGSNYKIPKSRIFLETYYN